MGDKELLEMAAKACGYEILRTYTDARCLYIDPGPNENGFHWNPLTSDSDAFRLVVKLGLFVDAYAPATTVGNVVCSTSLACKTRMEDHNGDAYAATRRAIVRAAAEIGKGMP